MIVLCLKIKSIYLFSLYIYIYIFIFDLSLPLVFLAIHLSLACFYFNLLFVCFLFFACSVLQAPPRTGEGMEERERGGVRTVFRVNSKAKTPIPPEQGGKSARRACSSFPRRWQIAPLRSSGARAKAAISVIIIRNNHNKRSLKGGCLFSAGRLPAVGNGLSRPRPPLFRLTNWTIRDIE